MTPLKTKVSTLMFIFLCSLLAATAQPAYAQTERVLYSFCSLPQCADGFGPAGGLIFDAQGNLYGTTTAGGSHCCGTLFELSPAGTETVVRSFAGGLNARPSGLMWDAKGNLYGVTAGAGRVSRHHSYYGSVFELKKRSFKHLYSFTQSAFATSGAVPQPGLSLDAQGNLYGTTLEGGAYGPGTVFELTPRGTESILHSFTGGADGGLPYDGLFQDSQGNFYGTASAGGDVSKCTGNGCGVVFKLSPDGTETVLYTFNGGLDGATPATGVTLDSEGNLYGTTLLGGGFGCFDQQGCGTVFKITPDRHETVLYSFAGGTDGTGPRSRLLLDGQGNLYGSTTGGGGSGCSGNGCGTVFELSPSGKETVLYRFTGGADGAEPFGDLLMDTEGSLYGTTVGGGVSTTCYDVLPGCGVVFKVTP